MEGGVTSKERDIVIFGAGSFATALAYVLSKNRHRVTLLTRHEEVARSINEQHHNPRYLSQFALPPNIAASARPEEVVPRAHFIVHAIPVQASLPYLKKIAHLIPPNVPLVSSSKVPRPWACGRGGLRRGGLAWE